MRFVSEAVKKKLFEDPSLAPIIQRGQSVLEKEYSTKNCDRNTANRCFRAAIYTNLVWSDCIYYAEAYWDIIGALKQRPEESNFLNFLGALTQMASCVYHDSPFSSMNLGRSYLMAIRKKQNSQLVPDFNFFAEAQYLLGVLYNEDKEGKKAREKSTVALITAVLNGCEAAKEHCKGQIEFFAEGGKTSFRFVEAAYSVSSRYSILRGLYANGEMDRKTYTEHLDSLATRAEADQNPGLLAKIQKERVLNADVGEYLNIYKEAMCDPKISNDKRMLGLGGILFSVSKSAQKEFAAAYEKEKAQGLFFKDYIETLKPIALWPSFITGCVMGYPVGILEHFLMFPIMIKMIYAKLHEKMDFRGEVVWDKEACPAAREFLGKLGFDEDRVSETHLYIAETCFGGLASWLGRGLGFSLSVLALAIASLVVFPIYYFVKSARAYKEGLEQFKNKPKAEKEPEETAKMNAVMANLVYNSKEKASCRTTGIFSRSAPKGDDPEPAFAAATAPALSL